MTTETKVKTREVTKTTKTTLRDQAVGVKDGNQTLVEKRRSGEVQLWRGKMGFGVVRVTNNHYEVILPCRISEEIARKVFNESN